MSALLLAPQPAPVDTGAPPIWPLVVEYLVSSQVRRAHAVTALLGADMRARDEQGRAKYGVPLTADNGRDHLVDAYQEALDLCAYLRADVQVHTEEERAASWHLFEQAVDLAWALRIRLAIRRGETR